MRQSNQLLKYRYTIYKLQNYLNYGVKSHFTFVLTKSNKLTFNHVIQKLKKRREFQQYLTQTCDLIIISLFEMKIMYIWAHIYKILTIRICFLSLFNTIFSFMLWYEFKAILKLHFSFFIAFIGYQQFCKRKIWIT